MENSEMITALVVIATIGIVNKVLYVMMY